MKLLLSFLFASLAFAQTSTFPALGGNVSTSTANTFATGGTLDLSAATSAAALRVPNIAGASSTTAGVISYDTTNKNWHVGANSVDNIVVLVPSSVSVTNNDCVKWSVSAGVVRLGDVGAACGAGGSGTVNAGTTNQLAYYASDGIALDGLTTANSSVLVTNGSGVPSWATTLPAVTLTTPILGVATATSVNKVAITAPATSATLTIANGKTLTASNTLTFTGTDASSVAFGAGGTVAYVANNLSVFAATTSAQLAGVLSDETGSGLAVFATSPTLTTPNIGVATATSINGLTVTSSTGTLTITNGKTLAASNTLTFTGTDSSSVAFGTGGTVAYKIASGTKALATSAISANTCTSAQTDAATGTLTTDVIMMTPNADITAVTGYGATSSDGLSITWWPTADTVNIKVCNHTSSSITPTALTLNYRVVR